MGAYCGKCQQTRDSLDLKCQACGSDQPQRGWPRDLLLGITLARRYRIDLRQREGALCVLYAGYDLEEQKRVAVWALHSKHHADERLFDQFQVQMRNVRKLQSEATARVIAVINEPGIVAYVTERSADGTLRDMLDSAGQLEPQVAVRIARQVALSLADAHSQGIVHRDVRPENILVSGAGTSAKLHGYGLESVRRHSMAGAASAQAPPSPHLAPEQLRRCEPEPASDLYALASVLFEMLTGRPPFDDPDPMVVRRHKLEKAAPPLGLAVALSDDQLAKLVDALLAQAPGDRTPQSAQAVADRLASIERRMSANGRNAISAETRLPKKRARRSKSPPRSSRGLGRVVLAAAFFGLLAGGGAAVWKSLEWAPSGSPPPPGPPPSVVQGDPASPVVDTPDAGPAVTQDTVEGADEVQEADQAPEDAGARSVADVGALDASHDAADTSTGSTGVEPPAAPDAGEVAVAAADVGAVDAGPVLPAVRSPVAVGPAKPATQPSALPAQRRAVLRTAHRGIVRVAAYTPDGRTLVTGAEDRKLHLTEAKSGLLRRVLTGMATTPAVVATGPEGAIAAGGSDGKVWAWTASGTDTARLVTDLRSGIRGLGFADQGRHLLVADQRRRLSRIELRTGQIVRVSMLGRGGPAYAVGISGDGTRLAVVNSGRGRMMVPRETTDGQVLVELKAIPHVTRVGLDRTGRWVVAGSSRGQVQIVHLPESADSVSTVQVVDHGRELTSLAIHPSLPRFATGGGGGSLRVWSMRDASVLPWTKPEARTGALTAMAFSPTEGQLWTAGSDLRMQTWDVAQAKMVREVVGTRASGAPLMVFDDRGLSLATAGLGGQIHVWDMRTAQPGVRMLGPASAKAIAYAPRTRELIVAGQDGYLRAYDGDRLLWERNVRDTFGSLASNGTEVVGASVTLGQARRFRLSDGVEVMPPIGARHDRLRTVAYAPGLRLLAAGSEDGNVALYDMAAAPPARLRSLKSGRGGVTGLFWRRDSNQLAVAHSRGGLLLFDMRPGQAQVPALQTQGMSPIGAVHLGEEVVTGGAVDGSIRRWGLVTTRPAFTRPDPGKPSPGWAVAPGGRLAAAASETGEIELMPFEPRAKAVVRLFAAQHHWVAWLPDGRYVGNAEGAKLLMVLVGEDGQEGVRPVIELDALKAPRAIVRALGTLR